MENNNNSSNVSVFVLVLVVLVSFAAGFFTGSIVEHLRKTLEDIKKNAKEIDKYFDDMFVKLFDPILERFHVETAERKYILAFHISGMHAVIMEWLKGGCPEPMEYIAGLLIKYILP